MKTKLIEAHDVTKFNHGKFMIGKFERKEWHTESAVLIRDCGNGRSLLNYCGWSPQSILVVDLQTGEGAIFRPGGYAKADLNKHKIWVCPMFEPFLVWLYRQDLTDLSKLPAIVDLGDVPVAMAGYRRSGVAE